MARALNDGSVLGFAARERPVLHCIDLRFEYVNAMSDDNAKSALATGSVTSPIGVNVDEEFDDVALTFVLLHATGRTLKVASLSFESRPPYVCWYFHFGGEFLGCVLQVVPVLSEVSASHGY